MSNFNVMPKRRLERHRRQANKVANSPTEKLVERLLFGDSNNDDSNGNDDDDDNSSSSSSSGSQGGSSSSSQGYNINKAVDPSSSSSSGNEDGGNGNSAASSTRGGNGNGAATRSSGGSSNSNDGNGNGSPSTAGNDYSSSQQYSSTYYVQSSSTDANNGAYSSSTDNNVYTRVSSSSSQPTSSYVEATTTSRDRASANTATSTSQAVETSQSQIDQATSSSSAIAAIVTAATTGSLTTSVQLITSTGTNANAAASTSAKSGSSVSAGPIIGIVAAALAGVVILGALAGFLIKKLGKKDKDPFETDPFDRDEFRRQSAMLPEGFDSDDGHPSMAEAHSYNNLTGMASSAHYDSGSNFASAAPVVGGIYGAGSYSHNENGRPRPPTMLVRHADAHGGNGGPVPPMPTAMYANGPQMPQMAFGGEDPYAAAGVSPSAGMQNISNPYAHLDRAPSNGGGYFGGAAAGAGAGVGAASALERSGSDNSLRNGQHSQNQDYYETSDRPGTSEGRSGTPDIPNVQQTYALGSENGHHSPASRQSAGFDFYEQYQYGNTLSNPHEGQQEQPAESYSGGSHHSSSNSPAPALQVRNLTNSGSQPYSLNQHHHYQQRSYGGGADESAYSGVY